MSVYDPDGDVRHAIRRGIERAVYERALAKSDHFGQDLEPLKTHARREINAMGFLDGIELILGIRKE